LWEWLRSEVKKVCAKFLKALNKKISIQKQSRHIAATKVEGKSFLQSLEDAQAVLDAVHAGKAEFLGTSIKGHQVFRVKSISGINVNCNNKITGQITDVFMIKETVSPSVVPTTPFWKPFS